MISRRCFFCGGPITGRPEKVWAQSFGSGPLSWHDAHPACAALLADDEGESDEGEEPHPADLPRGRAR